MKTGSVIVDGSVDTRMGISMVSGAVYVKGNVKQPAGNVIEVESDLAGYRRDPVYIRESKHVPLNREAVLDAMPAFFDLLCDETDPAVRMVLGHFVFVYIHPYMDGNGRMGRFLMNLMMAAGGYRWTVIPVTERKAYMAALEKASVGEDIAPFADFLARLVEKRLAGGPLPEVPKA